jgi:hypothetical protein
MQKRIEVLLHPYIVVFLFSINFEVTFDAMIYISGAIKLSLQLWVTYRIMGTLVGHGTLLRTSEFQPKRISLGRSNQGE